MRIEDWWSKVDSSTRQWLLSNNGDVVPRSILNQIIDITGEGMGEAGWVGENQGDGVLLSDAAIDWIEKIANDEGTEGG